MDHAMIVVGLGFGDEGKGTVVDTLCKEQPDGTKASFVVRFNGGAQAGHNVVTPDGRHHTFSQFGSGTFHDVPTYLSKYVHVNPLAMESEALHLEACRVKNPFRLMHVDRDALVTTPFQVAANRLRELLRGQGRHGSCGMGVGESQKDFLDRGRDWCVSVGDLSETIPALLREKLRRQQEDKAAEFSELSNTANMTIQRELDVLRDSTLVDYLVPTYRAFSKKVHIVDEDWTRAAFTLARRVVFEGAQGVLLDEDFGFHPYTTWSKTTTQNAEACLELGQQHARVTRVGVLRTFHTRHGAGPLPTEGTLSSRYVSTDHNWANEWQGSFRTGIFDMVLARYALNVCRVDCLALTHLDKCGEEVGRSMALDYCDRYFSFDKTQSGWEDVKGRTWINPPKSLNEQTQIAISLQGAHPDEYCRVERFGSRAVLDLAYMLTDLLERPLALASYGSTCNEKHVGSWQLSMPRPRPFWLEGSPI